MPHIWATPITDYSVSDRGVFASLTVGGLNTSLTSGTTMQLDKVARYRLYSRRYASRNNFVQTYSSVVEDEGEADGSISEGQGMHFVQNAAAWAEVEIRCSTCRTGGFNQTKKTRVKAIMSNCGGESARIFVKMSECHAVVPVVKHLMDDTTPRGW
jgi:hypothetical protein